MMICDLGVDDAVRADYNRIRDAFRDRWGAELPVVDCGIRDEHDCEIIVAARNRPECAALMKDFFRDLRIAHPKKVKYIPAGLP